MGVLYYTIDYMRQSRALDILKTGASVFLTGEPGAGKTHTINQYVTYLRQHGVEPAITASTGIAATHIQGQTIHSWSGIGIRATLFSYDLDQIASTEYIVRRIQKTQVLIIDEISMIDAQTLDMVDTVCREIRHSDEPFGGIQVVLVGDFFQLPPVSRGARFAFESQSWKQLQPVVCYLTEQHRQTDTQYMKLLTAIRTQSIDQSHQQQLQTRIVDESYIYEHSDTITRLFSHNANVDEINAHELSKLETLPTFFSMVTKGKDALVASLQKGCLSPEQLALKIGAVVMCTKNNQLKGYVNGTLGIVVGFEQGTKYPIIETRTGDRIVMEPVEWIIEENGKQKASIAQIPLRLAWAITIHKSQGMSMDAAIMDLREVFEYGQGYVALSRVRSLSGLYILGWNEKVFAVHPQIQERNSTLLQASEAADITFGDISQKELSAMHERFITAIGGVVSGVSNKKRNQEKISTLDQTCMLILQEYSLEEIAKKRGITKQTVLQHIEKLANQNKLAYQDIEYLLDQTLKKGLNLIRETMVIRDTSKLAVLHEHFKGKYTYDQLRMARIVFALDSQA